MRRLLLAAFFLASSLAGQTITQVGSATSATRGPDIVNNKNNPVIAWRITFWFTGFSAVTGQLDCAPDNGSGAAGAYAACAGAADGTTNPLAISGTPNSGTIFIKGFAPHVAFNPTSVTGSGKVNWVVTGLFGSNTAPTTVGGAGGGGGGMTLLASLSASGSATLTATTRNAAGQTGALFQSDFRDYLVKGVTLVPASSGDNLLLQFSSNGGSSWLTANYVYAYFFAGSAGGSGVVNSTSDSSVHLGNANSGAANASTSFQASVWNPLGGGFAQLAFDTSQVNSGDSNFYRYTGTGAQATGTAVNALRIQFSSGNITSGDLQIYGLAR